MLDPRLFLRGLQRLNRAACQSDYVVEGASYASARVLYVANAVLLLLRQRQTERGLQRTLYHRSQTVAAILRNTRSHSSRYYLLFTAAKTSFSKLLLPLAPLGERGAEVKIRLLFNHRFRYSRILSCHRKSRAPNWQLTLLRKFSTNRYKDPSSRIRGTMGANEGIWASCKGAA